MLAASQAVQRYLLATLDTRTRFPLRALPNRVSRRRSQLSASGAASTGPRMPLPALDEHVTQHLGVIGHDAVGAQIQEPDHLGPVVDGPYVDIQAERVRPVHERRG